MRAEQKEKHSTYIVEIEISSKEASDLYNVVWRSCGFPMSDEDRDKLFQLGMAVSQAIRPVGD